MRKPRFKEEQIIAMHLAAMSGGAQRQGMA